MEAAQGPGRDREDRDAVFDRVWRRVMADASACPIVWGKGGPAPEEEKKETGGPDSPPEAAVFSEGAWTSREDREPLHAPPALSRGGFPGGDCWGVLGPASRDSVPLLQQLLHREVGDGGAYQALARRAGGQAARLLAALAGEKRRRARRLEAACFLISGVRWWPEEKKCPLPASYLGALRRRFLEEQQGMAAYLTGVETTEDPCLKQLFCDLARGSWSAACQVRRLIERA